MSPDLLSKLLPQFRRVSSGHSFETNGQMLILIENEILDIRNAYTHPSAIT